MKNKLVILIALILVFIGLSINKYIDLNDKQKKNTSEFITKQIILCGKSIEDACLDFDEFAKFEFANYELQYFLDPNLNNSGLDFNSIHNDATIKKIRRFYSRNQELISKIIISNDSTFREIERKSDNYFFVVTPKKFNYKHKLVSNTQIEQFEKEMHYIQPIRNSAGEIVANITFIINVPNFIQKHFEKFYIGKNSWEWAINKSGQIIFSRYSEHYTESDLKTDASTELKEKMKNMLTSTLTHKIFNEQEINVFTVFYPIKIFNSDVGILFSIDTDTLWEVQSEANIAIFIYFLIIIIGIIALFSIIIKQMLLTKKRLLGTEALLRTANRASEVLLTNPDFTKSVVGFMEIIANTLEYHRAFLIQFQELEGYEEYKLEFEWLASNKLTPMNEIEIGRAHV